MGYFAVIDNDIVENIILAESQEIAESLTKKTCIESTESNTASIGSEVIGGRFKPLKESAHEDAVWDEATWSYIWPDLS